MDSTYGCVALRQRGVVAATKNWWALLRPEETSLILGLVSLNNEWAALKDTPVFLPAKSPSVPFRLIAAELVVGVVVLALCGPAPALPEIETALAKHWRSAYNLAASARSIYAKGFYFPGLEETSTAAAFAVFNAEKRRVLTSTASRPLLDVLSAFYRSVDFDLGAGAEHQMSETFANFDKLKCFALRHQQFEFYAIFPPKISTFSMRNSAHRTLQIVLKEKHFAIIK